MQVPCGMQTPLAESQREPAAQSLVPSQRSRGWQKPASLHDSATPQEASESQRQAPVAGSQEKPEAHWALLEQRLGAPFLQAARQSKSKSNRFT